MPAERAGWYVGSALCMPSLIPHLPCATTCCLHAFTSADRAVMPIPRPLVLTSILLLSTVMPTSLSAQTVAPPAPPTIDVSGTGELKVTPDRALVYVGVQTKGRTAALAGQENAKLATAILEAVRAAGVAREQIGTMNYSVTPAYRYFPDGRKPELTGYDASNTVRVEVRALELVGKVIDASLGAGANNITNISFFASQRDAVEREALGVATTDARLRADIMAKAAGGSLGPLVSLSSQVNDGVQPMPMLAMAMRAKAADESTPVVAPSEQTVTATVQSRWQFIPNPAAR
jgi:uncharacterized protein